jgi:hypothetical protein
VYSFRYVQKRTKKHLSGGVRGVAERRRRWVVVAVVVVVEVFWGWWKSALSGCALFEGKKPRLRAENWGVDTIGAAQSDTCSQMFCFALGG